MGDKVCLSKLHPLQSSFGSLVKPSLPLIILPWLPFYPNEIFFFIPLFLPLFQPQTHKTKSYHLLYFVLAFPFVWNFSSTTRYLHNLSRPTLSFCLNIFILMRPSLVTNLKSSLACTPPLCLSPSSPAPSNLLYSLLNYFDVGLSLCSE